MKKSPNDIMSEAIKCIEDLSIEAFQESLFCGFGNQYGVVASKLDHILTQLKCLKREANRKPGHPKREYKDTFPTYDAPGVCSFCGRMQCSGGCFK